MADRNIFANELNLIKSGLIGGLVADALAKVNDKFYHNGASSTGKYHPDYSAGDGGLVRHIKSVVYFGSIFIKEMQCSQYEKDCILATLILHDCCKSGINWEADYTVHEHPLLVFKLLDVSKMNKIEERAWRDINNLIATHMGQWVTSSHSSTVLPKISNKAQAIVHWSDYLGSRKAINVDHYKMAIKKPEIAAKEGSICDVFSEEIAYISGKDVKKMVFRLLTEFGGNLLTAEYPGNIHDWYNGSYGMVNKIKTACFVSNQLLNLEKTFIDEEDKDIVYATILLKEIHQNINIDALESIELVYWNSILGYYVNDKKTWEGLIINVSENISLDSSIEINYMKEETKDFRPATEKQVNRIKISIETFEKRENYDGRYDKINPEKLSIGQAGMYISEMKAALEQLPK